MNETINSTPQTSVNKTISSQKNLTSREVLNETHNQRLTPSFFIYKKGTIEHIEIPPDESTFKIGKSTHADVTLDDKMISDVQVAVVKMGNYCYFMDCGTKDKVYFNGIQKRQVVVPVDSRMIMKIGSTWVVYIGIDGHYYDETDSIILKRSLIDNPSNSAPIEAEILIKSNFGEWHSDAAPILVGSHNACDYKISGDEIKPFHFLLAFTPDGIRLEDLTQGKPGIRVDGLNSIGVRPVKEDLCVTINKLAIYLYVYGDPKIHCDTLFKEYNPKSGLAITPLSNGQVKAIPLPRTNEKLSVGRSKECNILIPDDPSVSRTHAHVIIRDKCLLVEDNQSQNKTYVNLKPIHKASVLPGDILEFGDSAYMLHYQ
ncbi:MAG: FHA domain-containing protein [Lentisphaerales bacterium]|nr:FHA domain-containing protein [Lentisphaerales bacterium]